MQSPFPEAVAVPVFWVLLGLQYVQLIVYWRRLPDSVAMHYGIDGEPGMYWPKWLFFVFWALFVAFNAFILYSNSDQVPMWFTAATLLFLLVIMQLVIMANIRGGRISVGLLLIITAAFVLLAWLSKYK